MEFQQSMIKYDSLKYTVEYHNSKLKYEKNSQKLKIAEQIASKLGDKSNDTAAFNYTFSFRGNNSFGAKVIQEYIVQVGPAPEFKLLNIAQEKGQMLVYPGGIPGDEELRNFKD